MGSFFFFTVKSQWTASFVPCGAAGSISVVPMNLTFLGIHADFWLPFF